jgi:glycosyltransferase involved in cell wall biosynthesis
MTEKIIVNATALKGSGALTILEQFINKIPVNNYEYIVFTNSGISVTSYQNNVEIISKNINGFVYRFLWDTFWAKKWLKENNIKALATVSLQNTNFRTEKSIPNFIYFHNAIPISDKDWNPFKKNERELWFYKRIYPFFIRLLINYNTEVFVQTNFVKNGFAQYFDFPKGKIHIILPEIELKKWKKSKEHFLDQNQLNLFYPATTYIFKNHLTIIKAICLLEKNIQQRITLYFTCKETELPFKIDDFEIHFNIVFLGTIDYEKVLQIYEEIDALLFPSYIETLGLPLIEAASAGVPIIVSDLPYSHEILDKYSGVTFVKHTENELWGREILKLFSTKGYRYIPLESKLTDSWDELFAIIDKKINKIA